MRFSTLLLFILISTFGWSQTTSLTTTFKFINIEEGYDHLCKTQVWVDGQMVGESGEVYESKGTSFTVQVPQGEHRMRIVNLAKYEGNWEEHTVENNYSIDCAWEGTQTFGSKAAKVFLLFDIDDTTQVSWKKCPSQPRADPVFLMTRLKPLPMVLSWFLTDIGDVFAFLSGLQQLFLPF